MPEAQLATIDHIVVLMLENRSFDHMLGFLYADSNNTSPAGQPFEGLTGNESNKDATGNPVTVFKLDPTKPEAYFAPGADPGEGYSATNLQLFGVDPAPTPPLATNSGFVTNYAETLKLDAARHRPILPGTTGRCFWTARASVEAKLVTNPSHVATGGVGAGWTPNSWRSVAGKPSPGFVPGAK